MNKRMTGATLMVLGLLAMGVVGLGGALGLIAVPTAVSVGTLAWLTGLGGATLVGNT